MIETERPITPTLAPPGRVSFEDFLEHGPETHAEWVDGEVINLSPPMEVHQDLSTLLASVHAPTPMTTGWEKYCRLLLP